MSLLFGETSTLAKKSLAFPHNSQNCVVITLNYNLYTIYSPIYIICTYCFPW
jgi:hypothetical protein